MLQTPDTFVRTPLPGAEGVEFIIHAAPQLGAGFTQMTAEFAAEARSALLPRSAFFMYSKANWSCTPKTGDHLLDRGGFAYLPEGISHNVRAARQCRAPP